MFDISSSGCGHGAEIGFVVQTISELLATLGSLCEFCLNIHFYAFLNNTDGYDSFDTPYLKRQRVIIPLWVPVL